MEPKKSFGELIQSLRKEKDWTVKQMIEQIGGNVTPAYVTRIEVYGEIPSPDLICKIAEAFDYDQEELLNLAKVQKIQKFETSLGEKYQKAAGLYRTQKTKHK